MSSTPNPSSVSLRPPSTHTLAHTTNKPTSLSPPTAEWMTGSWHVTHSTLPMWKGRFGVRITYTPLPETQFEADSTAFPNLTDLVEYQKASGGKYSSVNGVSRSTTVPELGSGWAFSWRGKGWLMIASSSWEVLGYGTDGTGTGRDWIVTYFSKTLFTPAGIDVYSRSEEGVSQECIDRIKAELEKLEDDGLKKLAGEVFFIPRK